jgi:hypothetical protein
MSVRTDHVAGGAFIVLGAVVLAISGELPFGTLSAPGAGMMPKLVAGLMLVLATVIMLGARASPPFAAGDWSDWRHAVLVVLVTGAAVMLYRRLGFLITMTLLVLALLLLVERRRLLPAALYSVGLTLFAYWLFGKALKAPLERGLLWF